MADTLKLDVIVDEHGAVQTLKNVDDGVNKVKGSAAATGLSTAQLNAQFDAMRGRLDVLGTQALPRTILGMSQLTVVSGLAVGALSFVAATLRQAAADADKFTAAGETLTVPASRIQQITEAAAGLGVGFDPMISALARLQARIGSGGLNKDLVDLGINLHLFRGADVTEQFFQIADAVSRIEDPAERAAMRVKLLGTSSEEMARLMKTSFREAADDVHAMSEQTIQRLDGLTAAWASYYSRVKTMAINFAVTGGMNAMGAEMNPGQLPGVSGPGGPGLAPVRTPDAAGVDLIDQNIKASIAMNQLRVAGEEANFAMDEYLRKIGQVTTFVPEFMALYDAQKLIAEKGLDWADVLNNNVAAAVDKVTGKLAQAMQINLMLSGEAGGRRDALTAQLTQTSNPNESDFDRRFNVIDARYKALMAMVDQTDRMTASLAENSILEATNLEVMQLQSSSGNRAGSPVTIDARGALFDTPGSMDALVRKIEQLMADRDSQRGGR